MADKVAADDKISGTVLPVTCDVAKEEDIVSMFTRIKTEYGGVDVCVNNAGVSHQAPLISGDAQHFRNMLDVSASLYIIYIYYIREDKGGNMRMSAGLHKILRI